MDSYNDELYEEYMLRFSNWALLLFIGIPLLMAGRSRNRQQSATICHSPATELTQKNVIIFIHGTIFIHHRLSSNKQRMGLYQYTADVTKKPMRNQLAYALHEADKENFPADSFYKFYWSGKLSTDARRKAAQELYTRLKNHTGTITLIAHSHGCSVALYLAELMQHDPQSSCTIDRLVLLAPPVQQATAELVGSNGFKRVYSLYSTADIFQVADPQGSSTFSKRTFSDHPQLTQARIRIEGQSPGHTTFTRPSFFSSIPNILELLDQSHTHQKNHVIVNIPTRNQKPHLLEPKGYIPRRPRSCMCSK